MRFISFVLSAIFAVSLFTAVPDNSFAAAKKEVVEKTAQASAKAKTKDIVKDIDINSADAATLEAIPGIGPKTADAVIKYRTANGNFKSVDDLLSVKGIGEKSLQKMKPFLKKI